MARHILCPIELDEISSRVTDLAARWARALDADLELVHVAATGEGFDPESVPAEVRAAAAHYQRRIEEAAGQAQVRLDALRALAEGLGARCATKLIDGRVDEAILEHARVTKAELIVLGPHTGRAAHWLSEAGIVHRLIGTVASRVVRSAPCPVLVACGAEIRDLPGPDGAWVVGVDFQPASRDALEVAVTLANRAGGALVLLHALPPILPPSVVISAAEGAPTAEDPGIDDGLETERLFAAEADLAAFAAPFQAEHADLRVVPGHVDAKLVLAGRDASTSVLVVGDHGRPRRPHLFLGSTVKRCLRNADVPVLVVRR